DTAATLFPQPQSQRLPKAARAICISPSQLNRSIAIMKVSELIQSKFLRKEDVEDETPVTIKNLKIEDMPGGNGEQRCVLYLREKTKGLVLNNPTIRALESAFGGESDDWVGKKAVLYVDPTITYMGKVTGGLRLRPIKKSVLVEPAKAAPPVKPDES